MAQAWRHPLAVGALHVVRETAQRRAGCLQRLLKHPAPADQLDAAQVLCLKPEQVEGVEAGARLAVAEQLVKVHPRASNRSPDGRHQSGACSVGRRRCRGPAPGSTLRFACGPGRLEVFEIATDQAGRLGSTGPLHEQSRRRSQQRRARGQKWLSSNREAGS